jgi:IMP dehydrogenase/GMP reductase
MINEEQNYEQILNILLTIETLRISNELAFYYDDQFKKAEEIVLQREEIIRKMVEMEYKKNPEEFKRTTKFKLQRLMMQERLDDLEELRKVNEEKLSNVREEVRKEIQSKERLGELILLKEQLFLNT